MHGRMYSRALQNGTIIDLDQCHLPNLEDVDRSMFVRCTLRNWDVTCRQIRFFARLFRDKLCPYKGPILGQDQSQPFFVRQNLDMIVI